MGRKEKINEAITIFEIEIASMLQDSERWKQFLDFSSEFYKYSFPENLLMFAQRPDVTMCATLEQWNSVGRWVKKGSKGIRLINDKDNEVSLKYVFDVTDTYGNEKILARRWRADEQDVVTILKDYYKYADENGFKEIISIYVAEYIEDELFRRIVRRG